MDLRKYIKEHPDLIFGHEPVKESLNVKRELKEFSKNPLETYLAILQKQETIFLDEINRFRQSFNWYTLSLERVLHATSIARRAQQELKYHPRNEPYSTRRKTISFKYQNEGKYIELDFENLIFHSVLLLNRSLTVSRSFFSLGEEPNFVSFRKHKKFFKKNKFKSDFLKSYSNYIQNDTNWFEIPLLLLRDKYLMHAIDPHMNFLGWSNNWNLELIIILPVKNRLNNVKVIRFNPRRLARDIHQHFCHIRDLANEISKQKTSDPHV